MIIVDAKNNNNNKNKAHPCCVVLCWTASCSPNTKKRDSVKTTKKNVKIGSQMGLMNEFTITVCV